MQVEWTGLIVSLVPWLQEGSNTKDMTMSCTMVGVDRVDHQILFGVVVAGCHNRAPSAEWQRERKEGRRLSLAPAAEPAANAASPIETVSVPAGTGLICQLICVENGQRFRHCKAHLSMHARAARAKTNVKHVRPN